MTNKQFKILRSIKETSTIEKDHSTDELVHLGYLTKDLQLTEQGEVFLEQHKVDNAIIIAAGLGSRFVPQTILQPKGLIEVKGEAMVERQIKQLHEVGITDISIVVGYLAEQFDYLKDKYGVSLIFNDDFSRMNNISSLYHAREELKNTYILPSDIYMKENLYHTYENNSWYGSVYFDGETTEWSVAADENDLISDIKVGGKDCWVLYGPAFINREFSDKFKTFVQEDYHLKKKNQYFWENVYMDHMNECDLYVERFESNIIYEFESFEELRAYDTSYVEDSRNPLIKKIAEVLEVKESDIRNCVLLEKGMTNKSFVFEINGNKYVFRHPGEGSEKLINRYQEYEVYQAIAPLDISDEVIYMEPHEGIKITKFYENCRQSSSTEDDDIKATLDLDRKLHHAKIKVDHKFDLRERLGYYQELMTEVNGKYPDDFKEVLNRNMQLLDYMDELGREHVLCHIDSIENNVLKLEDDSYRLIDWEYAGMSDPLIDLAAYTVYSGFEEDKINWMANYYFEREATFEEINVLYSHVSLISLLWAIWSWYKAEFGEDFSEYADEQYHYAKKYSKLVLERIKND